MIYIDPNSKKVNNVTISINDTCFFRCKMCNIWKNKQSQKLSIDTYKAFFSNLTKIKGPDTVITFTGGETLSEPMVFDLISIANKYGFVTNINTNGWLLTNEVIEKLYNAGLKKIGISLDGSVADIHDKIRGKKGSFKKIMDSIPFIKKFYHKKGKDIRLDTYTVISNLNLEDIEDLVNKVNANKFIDAIKLQVIAAPLSEESIVNGMVVTPNGTKQEWFNHKDFKHLWPKDKEKLLKLYSKLLLLKRKGYSIDNSKFRLEMQYLYFTHPGYRRENFLCTVYEDIVVSINGDVMHCVPKNEVLGNIKKEDISSIWNSVQSKNMRKNIVECKENCRLLVNCGFPAKR